MLEKFILLSMFVLGFSIILSRLLLFVFTYISYLIVRFMIRLMNRGIKVEVDVKKVYGDMIFFESLWFLKDICSLFRLVFQFSI